MSRTYLILVSCDERSGPLAHTNHHTGVSNAYSSRSTKAHNGAAGLFVGEGGELELTWVSQDKGQRVQFDGTGWQTQGFVFSPVNDYPPLLAFASGKLYALYASTATVDYGYAKKAGQIVLGQSDAATATSDETILMQVAKTRTSGAKASPLALHVTDTGTAHAIWAVVGGDHYHSTNASGSWVNHKLAATRMGGAGSFFFTSDGTPHTCFYVPSTKEAFLLRIDGAKGVEEKLPVADAAIHCTLDRSGQPAVMVGNTLLRRAGKGWTQDEVPSYKPIQEVRLAFDKAGKPHIAHSIRVGSSVLRYAHR